MDINNFMIYRATSKVSYLNNISANNTLSTKEIIKEINFKEILKLALLKRTLIIFMCRFVVYVLYDLQ